jgi:hypothetical protein
MLAINRHKGKQLLILIFINHGFLPIKETIEVAGATRKRYKRVHSCFLMEWFIRSPLKI